MISFSEEVQMNLKTKDQVYNEEAKRKEQEYRSKICEIAEYYYNKIKEAILSDASKGNHDGTEIKGFCRISEENPSSTTFLYDHGFFAVKHSFDTYNTGGIFHIYKHVNETCEVMNLRNLLDVFSVMEQMAKQDSIVISEPFYLEKVYIKKEPTNICSQKEFHIKNNRLIGKLEYVTIIRSDKERYGDLALGMNYIYRISN